MKKLICSLLVFCFVLVAPVTAAATDLEVTPNANELTQLEVTPSNEEFTEIITSYRTDNSLYSYICFDGGVPTAEGMTLLTANEERFKVASLESCIDEHEVKLVLLIDNSAKMKSSRDSLVSFARELMAKGPKKMSVTVATQAKDFSVVAENIRDWEQLEQTLLSIPYDQYTSNPCGGTVEAMKLFDSDKHKNGEMLNLLVFSDGTSNFATDQESIGYLSHENSTKASNAILEHPEVLVHTLTVNNRTTEETKALMQGKGVHLRLAGRLTEEVADELVSYLCGIHVAKVIDIKLGAIDLDGLSYTYKTQNGIDSVLHDVPLGDVVDLNKREIIQPVVPAEVTETKTEPEVSPEPTDTTAVTEATAGATEATVAEYPDEGQTEESETEEVVTEEEDTEPENENNKLPKSLLIAIPVLLAAIAAVLTIVIIRRKNSGAIVMQLTVEYGRIPNLKDHYYLKKSMIIGSGKGCDVVIPSAIVSQKNTRVYLENGQIFVEDMGSKNGTLLGGMKLHAPNRLRSGDVITVGNTSIRFLF